MAVLERSLFMSKWIGQEWNVCYTTDPKEKTTRLVKQRLPSVSTGPTAVITNEYTSRGRGVRADGDSSIRTSAFGGQPAKPHAWFLPLFAPRRMTDRSCCHRSSSQPFRGMPTECSRERTSRNLLLPQALRNKNWWFTRLLFLSFCHPVIKFIGANYRNWSRKLKCCKMLSN